MHVFTAAAKAIAQSVSTSSSSSRALVATYAYKLGVKGNRATTDRLNDDAQSSSCFSCGVANINRRQPILARCVIAPHVTKRRLRRWLLPLNGAGDRKRKQAKDDYEEAAAPEAAVAAADRMPPSPFTTLLPHPSPSPYSPPIQPPPPRSPLQ